MIASHNNGTNDMNYSNMSNAQIAVEYGVDQLTHGAGNLVALNGVYTQPMYEGATTAAARKTAKQIMSRVDRSKWVCTDSSATSLIFKRIAA